MTAFSFKAYLGNKYNELYATVIAYLQEIIRLIYNSKLDYKEITDNILQLNEFRDLEQKTQNAIQFFIHPQLQINTLLFEAKIKINILRISKDYRSKQLLANFNQIERSVKEIYLYKFPNLNKKIEYIIKNVNVNEQVKLIEIECNQFSKDIQAIKTKKLYHIKKYLIMDNEDFI